MKNRLSLVAVVLCPCVVLASSLPTRPDFDAFTQAADARALKLEGALPSSTAQLVAVGRVSAVERRLGVPSFFFAGRSGASAGLRGLGLSAEQAARRYLLAYAALYRFEPASLAEARLERLHDVGQGAIVATFTKPFDGVRVFRDELKVVMNQRLELVALSGYLTPARRALGDFRLAPITAIGAAHLDLTGRPLESSRLSPLDVDGGGYQRFWLAGQSTPVRVRAAWYALPAGLVPAFYVELDVGAADSTSSSYFSYVISATDGAVLSRKNLTAADSYSYRVWADATGLKLPFDGPQGNAPSPHPTGMPNQYNPQFVAPALVTTQNGPISTNDAWLAPNATETRGNNAFAYADLAAPSGFGAGDLKATVTAPGVFDRVYDVSLSPDASADQRMAAITQLFFDVNAFHDWYYDVGFDEKSGNAQTDNLGRGGLGGDALLAEGQDYSGRSNADMSTPSDGAHPRMQMYIFDAGAGPQVLVTGGASYRAGAASFGPQSFTVAAEAVLVNDADPSGAGGSVSDGCQSPFVSSVSGKVAVIDRGLCTFAEKVINAEANGAVGVIIVNNTQGPAPDLQGSGATAIPALSLSRTSGAALKGLLAAGVVTLTLSRPQVVDRDGTIDNAIVAHEWGHYISNRLIGDGNGISNNQAVGMGEGWADFHSMLLVVKEGDDLVAGNLDFTGAYALAAYTSYGTDPNGYYYGIRRYPYSTDLLKNPLTFKHIAEGVALPANVPVSFGRSGNGNSESHATGEVWATMLWECYASLLRDRNRYTFDQARDVMRAYLVAAYKVTPMLPTFVDARDALLSVAAAQDLTDYALFSAAFAKRGLGLHAVAPDKDSQNNAPVVEDFVTGNSLDVVKVTLDDSVSSCDHDGILDNVESGLLSVTIKNVGVGALQATTATVTTSTPGLTLANGGQLSFPATAPFGSATASLQVSLLGMTSAGGAQFELTLSDPSFASSGPITARPQFRVNYDAKGAGASRDDVEAPTTLWKFGDDPNGATGSDFRRYEDSATAHWFFGPDPDSPADTWLVSPPLSVAAAGPFGFSFSHRFEFEADANENYDGAVVELSTDHGRTWTDLGSALNPGYGGTLSAQGSNPLRGKPAFVGKSAGYPAFSTVQVDLGQGYAGKTVQVRFRIGSDDAVGLKGWEIDDVAFTGLATAPFPSVVRDPNSCTNHPPVVSSAPAMVVDERSMVTLVAQASDVDADPTTVTFTRVSGPEVTMAGSSFLAPEVTADTVLTFDVVANDGKTDSAPATLTVTVRNVNRAPVAVGPEGLSVVEGQRLLLPASASDPDGEAIAGWRWSQVQGPPVTLEGSASATAAFTAPQVDADTVLVFAVAASDGQLEGPEATVSVTVTNVAGSPKVGAHPCGCGAAQGNGASLALMAMGLAMVVWRRRRG